MPADLSNNRTENLDRYKCRHYTKNKSTSQGFCLIMFFKTKFVYNFCHIKKLVLMASLLSSLHAERFKGSFQIQQKKMQTEAVVPVGTAFPINYFS